MSALNKVLTSSEVFGMERGSSLDQSGYAFRMHVCVCVSVCDRDVLLLLLFTTSIYIPLLTTVLLACALDTSADTRRLRGIYAV